MQTSCCHCQIILACLLVLACKKTPEPESFDAAIAKHRNTLVDQVNAPENSAPFFTIKTLNPVWNITAKTPIVTIPHFNLIDQDGKRRDESLFDGKITIVGFIFAACNGFCPFLVQGMKAIEKDVIKSKSNVQFVAFTVNPEEDTPAVLRDYAREHHLNTRKNWTLLTGSKETVMAIVKNTFASQAFKRTTVETNFAHSEHLYVIDSAKNLRGILNGTRIDIKEGAHAVIGDLARR